MKLIIGLGNPGEQYDNTWHNLGFLIVDILREQFDLPAWKHKPRLRSMISLNLNKSRGIILAKPQTYMNLSGEAAARLKSFYKLDNSQIYVVHDDADLEKGDVRFSPATETGGGHKGVESIINSIGKDFKRIRIGIGRPPTATTHYQLSDYVLSKIDQDSLEQLSNLGQQVRSVLESS